ncbi:MAG TPA: hypothetical protein VGL35_08385 [Rhizomicrobium sp.]|jgi:hypothetical protein
MLKLSHTTRNAALSALLAAGVAGSAAVTIAPVAAHAQPYRDRDYTYHRDWDAGYRADWDDRYRADRDYYYHRDWDGRNWVGIGVPGFGIGFYDYPYYNGYYGPYCSDYDYDNGFCTY